MHALATVFGETSGGTVAWLHQLGSDIECCELMSDGFRESFDRRLAGRICASKWE
ncbi:hypothetical protein D9M68_947510 [compost metagenome]